MPHVFSKGILVRCAINSHASGASIQTHRTDNRCRVPVPVRGGIVQALTFKGATAQAGHVCLCTRLVQKHKVREIESALLRAPFFTVLRDISTILFAGP